MREIIESYAARLQQEAARSGARRRRGMTLMEVMIVIAIILLLMGALTFGLAGMFGEAQADTARLTMSRIDQKVKIYRVRHNNEVPSNLEDIYKNEEPPKDPWGNTFRLTRSGNGYDIVSYGADGKEGGTGTDADIKLSEASK